MDSSTPTLFPDLEQEPASTHRTGLLPSQHIVQLISAGRITAASPVTGDQIQPASMDLRLGPVAYRVHASFLPGKRSTVAAKIEELRMHEPLDLSAPTMLERGCVYIIPLQEELNLPAAVSGKANPKSTTGRLDIFTRLITDYSAEFERVQPGYRGRLYVEVVPRTFNVLVQQGTKLNQIRFSRGAPSSSDAALDELHRREGLVYLDDVPGEPDIGGGLRLSLDLSGGDGSGIVGFRARAHGLIDLRKVGHYDPRDFWEPIHPSKRGIILEPDDFYILVSRERVRVPPTHAAEMVAYEPPFGEFRVHYAGFFDPGFGHGGNTIQGTPGVLEVRPHEVPFLLEHGQTIGRLVYERLVEVPEKLYGQQIGSSYQSQGLTLSKQFKPW